MMTRPASRALDRKRTGQSWYRDFRRDSAAEIDIGYSCRDSSDWRLLPRIVNYHRHPCRLPVMRPPSHDLPLLGCRYKSATLGRGCPSTWLPIRAAVRTSSVIWHLLHGFASTCSCRAWSYCIRVGIFCSIMPHSSMLDVKDHNRRGQVEGVDRGGQGPYYSCSR